MTPSSARDAPAASAAPPPGDAASPASPGEGAAAHSLSPVDDLASSIRTRDRSLPSMVYFAKVTAVVMIMITLAGLAWLARPVLASTFVALFLAAGLEPVIQRLVRKGLRRALAITVLVSAILTFAVLFLLLALLPAIDQFSELAAALPELLQDLAQREDPVSQAVGESTTASLVDRLVADAAGPAGVLGVGGLRSSRRRDRGRRSDIDRAGPDDLLHDRLSSHADRAGDHAGRPASGSRSGGKRSAASAPS